MINKKGEITTAQIVTIIVLIVSFIVILFFFFRLNLGATTNSEICHNSVVLKAKSVGISGDLKCKTDYVCISGGGTCADMNPTETVNVDSNSKDEIMNAIADKMADCWWMFGEGKMNYGDKGIIGSGGCALCSVVAFDEKASGNSITYSEFYNYLANTKKDEAQTYLVYLYEAYDADTLAEQYPILKINAGNNILGSEKFGIVTGYNTGLAWGIFGGNGIMPVSYLRTDRISPELQCSNFITEA
ncbi:MAG: hypothetical protein PHH00_03700 [Candidatus Nanoarchaeia archaeon]|nr:hypothetical protein [Candidatus Nanoarchaeia archaeon]